MALSDNIKKARENQGSHKDTFKGNRLRGTQSADSMNLRTVCLSAYFSETVRYHLMKLYFTIARFDI